MSQHVWPGEFDSIKSEILAAWHVKGAIDVVRALSGRSGATILQVDIETDSHKGMAILKLMAQSDVGEIQKHEDAYAEGGQYASHHFPRLVNRHTSGNGMALLFSVAGKSLHQVQPFTRIDHLQQMEATRLVFSEVLANWNTPQFREGLFHPSALLREWVTKKAKPGGRLQQLSEEHLGIPTEAVAFSIGGHWLPNPLAWLDEKLWDGAESIKTLVGRSHGDLHGDNLLIRLAGGGEPYYLIDFSFYAANAPLFYDNAYFEISYLLKKRGTMHVSRWVSLITALETTSPADGLVADDAGVLQLVTELRRTAQDWTNNHHAERAEHLSALYALARVASGLNLAGKRLDSNHECLLAYVYAGIVLRAYLDRFGLPWNHSGPALQSPDPTPPPSREAWRAVWEDCDQFDPTRNIYILITGRHHGLDSPIADVLGRIPWSLVLDFDPDSKNSGIYSKAAATLKTERAVREMLADSVQSFNQAVATAWFFAGGLDSRPDMLQADLRSWRRATIPAIRAIATDLRDSIAPIPVTVLVLRGDISDGQMTSTWEALDEVLGDEARYVEAGQTMSNPTLQVQAHEICTEDLLRGLWLMYGHKGAEHQVLLPARALGEDRKTLVTLSGEDAKYFAEDLTLVHDGLAARNDTDVTVGLSFWRGGEITWTELDMDADVRRDAGVAVATTFLDKIDKFAATIVSLEHKPGAGGTTIARRMLWDLRDQYPCVLIHNVSEHTAGRLEHLYHVTRLPLIIVAEANVVPTATRDSIVRDLKARNVRFAMCHVVRTVRQSSRHTVPEPMDPKEASRFYNRYKAIAPEHRLSHLKELTESDEYRRFRTPFFYGLYSFEEDFTHVGDYVKAHVEDVPDEAREVAGLLALASRFSQEGLLDSIVLKLLNLSERVTFRMPQLFGESFPRILRLEDRRLRFAHPLLAQEGLRQIYGETWKEKLADLSCEFIEKLVGAATAHSEVALRIFTSMFISRDFWDEERERKRQFSELILAIQNHAGQHRVLQKLTELCPNEEPHLTGGGALKSKLDATRIVPWPLLARRCTHAG